MRTREENLARLRSSLREVALGQKFSVKVFAPEDAQGLASLYYASYGENFPLDFVYDPDQLIEANVSRRMRHFVGKTESGDIIGAHAFFRNPPGKHIMEVGSWLVHPAYRNTTLAIRLTQHTLGNPAEHVGLHVIFTQCVCDQIISQKVAEKYRFISCALELEAMPARPSDAHGRSEDRISLLDGFIMRTDVPHAVRLPAAYAETLRHMYAARGLQREFLPDVADMADVADVADVADEPSETGQGLDRVSRCVVQPMEGASLVKMTLDVIGRDIAARIHGFDQEHPDQRILHLILPLWGHGATLAVEAARNAGFFLGGLLPLWADRDMLLMQKLRTPPNYSAIQLYTQEAKELLERIVADRASLAP